MYFSILLKINFRHHVSLGTPLGPVSKKEGLLVLVLTLRQLLLLLFPLSFFPCLYH